MSQQPQMTMAAMGGPVGGGAQTVGTPSQPTTLDIGPDSSKRKLNTAIYDYFLRTGQYELARSLSDSVSIDKKNKESPSQRAAQQANGVDENSDDPKGDQHMINRPEGLPLPDVPFGGYLEDWWLQFHELYHGQRGRGTRANTQQFISNQRLMQKGRMGMMGAMDPAMQNRLGYGNMMQGMNNGMAMTQNDLRKSAMQQNNQQRNLTPQQMQQMKMANAQQNSQMMQGNAMERQNSQMDGSGPRSGSPGSGDGPSSPKRQRLEGNMAQMNQGRPGQPGQMQGNQVGPSDIPQPDQSQIQHTLELLREKGIDPKAIAPQQLQNLSLAPTNIQAQSVEVYSQSIQQQMTAAMHNVNKSNVNKGMNPNMGPGGAQGSPMNQGGGMEGAAGEFYTNMNGRMPMPNNNNAAAAAAAAAANQGQNSNGNHALQDYQMQLMLLEQQNKKRLLMARQEQDMAHPAGVGPNGQFAPGMSPQGSQRGADPSPNPNEMRGSPTPGMMDPNQIPPNIRQQMVMGPNGMRPPSSHPMAANLTPQQMEQMRQQGGPQMPNGQMQGGPQMMQGQQPGQQPGQPQPQGTPRQQNNNMPPPPAPPANAGGTQPSSPSQPPPTPNTASKAKPGNKKEPANKKGAANKKGGAGQTATTESEQPPTPTPPTPATPMNANSFGHKANQQLPNGQPAPAQANASGNANQQAQQQQAANATQPQPPPSDMNGPFGAIMDDASIGNLGLDFDVGNTGDLENFDFDTFLNADVESFGFDANFAFDGIETGLDGTN